MEEQNSQPEKNLQITNIWIKFASVFVGYLLLRLSGSLVMLGACWYPRKGLGTLFCNTINTIDTFIWPVFLVGNILYSLVYLSKKGRNAHFAVIFLLLISTVLLIAYLYITFFAPRP